MKIKLSFIIPVYNVEDYLRECLDSILSQTTDECEVLLIDDGSTDNSGKICDEYAEKYKIISVVHKVNGGLASARNSGMKLARGEYIAFIDSDDRIAPKAVRDIIEWISWQGTDICFMEAEKFFPDGKTENLGDRIDAAYIRGKSKEETFAYLSTRPKYPGSACTKIYKRSFLEKNCLYFPDDGRYSEDLGFVMSCLLAAESFDALSIPYYEYRQRRVGSITYTATKKSFDGMAAFAEESVEKLTENNEPKNEICRCALAFVAYEYSIMLWRFGALQKDTKQNAKDFLEKNKWVMNFGYTKKLKLIKFVHKIFGYEITSYLLDFYMRHRSSG